jgi:hypothetical protein
MAKFTTLINTRTKEYINIIGNEKESQVVISDTPIFVSPDTVISDLIIKYPNINVTDVGIIDIEIERKGYTKPAGIMDNKRAIFKFSSRMEDCPLCNTRLEEDAALVMLADTTEDNIATGAPVHVDCLIRNSVYYKEDKLIAAKIK